MSGGAGERERRNGAAECGINVQIERNPKPKKRQAGVRKIQDLKFSN
jgi:hypothetical protein